MVEGAVPEEDETVNQLPPSAVLVDKVQLSDPAPAFRIWKFCEGELAPAMKEKLNAPGRSSRYGTLDTIVRVTGTVMLVVALGHSVSTTDP
jgi:hypothetical protein